MKFFGTLLAFSSVRGLIPLPPEDRVDCQDFWFGTNGKNYVGHVHTTVSGLECQRWSDTHPHDIEQYRNSGPSNFCRNPE